MSMEDGDPQDRRRSTSVVAAISGAASTSSLGSTRIFRACRHFENQIVDNGGHASCGLLTSAAAIERRSSGYIVYTLIVWVRARLLLDSLSRETTDGAIASLQWAPQLFHSSPAVSAMRAPISRAKAHSLILPRPRIFVSGPVDQRTVRRSRMKWPRGTCCIGIVACRRGVVAS